MPTRTSVIPDHPEKPRIGPSADLRRVGTTWQTTSPPCPLRAGSHTYRSTYEVVAHVRAGQDEGGRDVFREDVRRVKFERL